MIERTRSGLSTTHQTESLSPRAINVRIEELVLHGFPSGDRYAIAEAVERELTRLFVEQGLSPSLSSGGEFAHLDAGNVELAAGFGADVVGAEVARAVFGRLNR